MTKNKRTPCCGTPNRYHCHLSTLRCGSSRDTIAIFPRYRYVVAVRVKTVLQLARLCRSSAETRSCILLHPQCLHFQALVKIRDVFVDAVVPAVVALIVQTGVASSGHGLRLNGVDQRMCSAELTCYPGLSWYSVVACPVEFCQGIASRRMSKSRPVMCCNS